jgi:ABC-type Fe3+-citrate transport system substrate-binding protein
MGHFVRGDYRENKKSVWGICNRENKKKCGERKVYEYERLIQEYNARKCVF